MNTDNNSLDRKLQVTFVEIVPNPSDFKYFNIGKHWTNKIKPVLESKEAQNILHHDFRKFTKLIRSDVIRHYKDIGLDKKAEFSFKKGDELWDWDIGWWRYSRIGRPPAYDNYVCHQACHWVVNTLLYSATKAFPKIHWQIVTSDKHSTVWDGQVTFFDLNYFAMKIPPAVCFESTFSADGLAILPVGQFLRCH